MLDIPVLAVKWGKIFKGVNTFNLFRGTELYDRADEVNAEFPDAAEQRVVVDNLYDLTTQLDGTVGGLSTYYVGMSRDTLSQSCIDDSVTPSGQSETAYITKLITDMLATTPSASFLLPDVTIGGAETAEGTDVATLAGLPYGDGILVGTIIDPIVCIPRLFPFTETLQFSCISDSYTSGVTAGRESFSVTSELAAPIDGPYWPGGSGLSQSIQGQPSVDSTLFGNAYFEEWGSPVTNTPADWALSNLVAGTTITRSSEAYTGDYAASFNAAITNAEVYQTISGLTGGRNYLVAFRYRRLTDITTGVVTLALRTAAGAVIDNAAGDPLSLVVSVTGGLGPDYEVAYAVFSVPRGFAASPRISLRFTTAMTAAESVLIDTVELILMESLYVGGPDVALLSGTVGWAVGDTYTLAVSNNASTDTFLRNIQRAYPGVAVAFNWPVSATPTISNDLITN
jgi:hypothetical protein